MAQTTESYWVMNAVNINGGQVSSSNAALNVVYTTTDGNGLGPGTYSFIQATAGTDTFIGVQAGENNIGTASEFNSNTGIGYQSLYSVTAGGPCTAIGYQSLYSNTTGGLNTAIGYQSLYSNTTGGGNVAIGYKSLRAATADNNVAVGYYNLHLTTTGYQNTAIGGESLFSNTTGYQNTATGYNTLYNLLFGANNTVIGWQAGLNYTGSESNNIVIGSNVNGTAGESNIVRLGTLLVGDQSTGILSTALVTSSYAWIKGKNRLYQQNLTASTTTATAATLLGTSMAVTPAFSGYLVVNATIRANNNTLSDGVTVSIYQGASSGALTTLLDSDTYTQEGLASNSETLSLHYELSGQTVGTATYISLAFNAVTGGTASAKIVNFAVQEI